MKTLIFCPTGPDQYGWAASIRSIKALEGDYDLMLSSDNPRYTDADNILYNYRLGRQFCLEGDYGALLTVESDIIVPPDALSRLLEVEGATVVYGLYCFRRPDYEWNLHRKGPPGRSRVFIARSFSRRGEGRLFYGRVSDVGGLGLGCTLIYRHVLEKINFRLDLARSNLGCDYWLAQDVHAAGFPQKGHAGVVCGHIRRECCDVLWPVPNERGYELGKLDNKRRHRCTKKRTVISKAKQET